MEEGWKHNLDPLLRFLAGLSGFLFFLTISLTLLVISGHLPLFFPLFIGITFIFSLILSLIVRKRIKKESQKQVQVLLDQIREEEEKAIGKTRDFIGGLVEEKRYLTIAGFFNSLSLLNGQIFRELVENLCNQMETLKETDQEILDLISAFLIKFNTREQKKGTKLVLHLSRLTEKFDDPVDKTNALIRLAKLGTKFSPSLSKRLQERANETLKRISDRGKKEELQEKLNMRGNK